MNHSQQLNILKFFNFGIVFLWYACFFQYLKYIRKEHIFHVLSELKKNRIENYKPGNIKLLRKLEQLQNCLYFCSSINGCWLLSTKNKKAMTKMKMY